jgi:tetratricopeptide (TPR) repeat protein
VEALLGQAYCVWRSSPEQLQALVAGGVAAGEGRSEASVGGCAALHNAGVDWYGIGQLSVAETLLQQALAIYEKLAPNSLDVAGTLNNLGSVALDRGDLARAEQLYSAGVGDLRKTRPQLAEGGRHAQQSGKCGC